MPNIHDYDYLEAMRRNTYVLATGVHDQCWHDNERLASALRHKGCARDGWMSGATTHGMTGRGGRCRFRNICKWLFVSEKGWQDDEENRRACSAWRIAFLALWWTRSTRWKSMASPRSLCGWAAWRWRSRVPYAVIVDRISHDVPFYRSYLKNAVLTGTQVINNPFWWSADDKFFNYALAEKSAWPLRARCCCRTSISRR